MDDLKDKIKDEIIEWERTTLLYHIENLAKEHDIEHLIEESKKSASDMGESGKKRGDDIDFLLNCWCEYLPHLSEELIRRIEESGKKRDNIDLFLNDWYKILFDLSEEVIEKIEESGILIKDWLSLTTDFEKKIKEIKAREEEFVAMINSHA